MLKSFVVIFPLFKFGLFFFSNSSFGSSKLNYTIFAQKINTIELKSRFKISGNIESFDDSTFKLKLKDIVKIQQQNLFKTLKGDRFKKSNSVANHWLHFKVYSDNETELFLELDNPRLNKLEFYEIFSDSVVNQIHTGDSEIFSSRGFAHNKWAFPIKLNKQQKDIYLMVNKENESLDIGFNLTESQRFHANTAKKYMLWGILLGLTLIVILISSFIWIATNDSIYIWFVLIILTTAFHLTAGSGLGFQYIWPNFPALNFWYPQTFSTWILIIFQVGFMQKFIGQTAQNSKVYWWVKVFIYSIIVIFIFSILLLSFNAFPKLFFRYMLVTSLVFNILLIPLALFSIFERIRNRENIVIFFTIVSLFKALILIFYITNFYFKFTQFGSLDVTTYGFIFDLIVLFLGVIYFSFSKYRRQNEALLTQIHDNEQEQSKKIIDALEIERNRIAEDLYDDVGAMLSTAIGYQSSVLRKPENKEKFPILLESRKLLDKAVENLRTVSHNLMPKNFAELGLSKSLEETVNKVAQNSEIVFDYQLVGLERKLDQAKEVQIFRIASELINDILRNSKATKATIQLIYGAENLILMAEDDGKGEPIHNNLTSKVDFINGKLEIDFNKNGLTAVVEIPYY